MTLGPLVNLTAKANGDRHIVLSALGAPQATTANAWTFTQNGGSYFNGYTTNGNGPAVNDSFQFWPVWLDAGTWQLDLLSMSAADGGQISASLVGTDTVNFSGIQEQYAPSGAAIRTSFAAVTIARAGLYSLKLTIGAKNASSSGFRCRCSGAILLRTA